MGDEETPDPGNLTHLASDREQEDRRQEGPGHPGHPGHLHTAHGNMENTFLFLVTVLALLWFIPSCIACRSVHLKLYAKIVVILLLFAT